MASSKGGKREGSGRPPTATRQIRTTEAVIARINPHVEQLIETQLREAFGGYDIIEEEYVPSRDAKATPGTVVLSKRKLSKARPNLGALESLLNRAVGRPAQQLDLSLLEDKGGAMNMTPELAAKLRAVYAEYARTRLAEPSNGTATH